MTSTMYPQSEQERQLMLCSSFIEHHNAQDIHPDRIVSLEDMDAFLLPEDDNSLAALCWRAQVYGFGTREVK